MTLESTVTAEGRILVAVSGRLDMVSAPKLKAFIASTVEEGNLRLVIDLSDVRSMDSSGLGALISGYRAANQAGGSLLIAGAVPQVRRVLELTRVDQLLHPYASVDEAVQATA